jgi:4-amino-4-deoxy-L-arabinose transferase-like glycosyltransferase
MAALGLLSLGALALINGLPGGWLTTFNVHVQFALLCGGIGLVIAGLSRIGQRKMDTETPLRWQSHHLILLGITALALALRLWQLDSALHYPVDELGFADAAAAIGRQPALPLLARFSEVYAFPWLYPYWQAVSLALFGNQLGALRLVSALLGALTIPAVYGLGRALFDRPTGLAAALLLATFPPHLHFSRLGLNNIADPLFGTLALVLLVRGQHNHKRGAFVLGGVCLGLTQYFYEGGRLLFPPLALIGLGVGTLFQRRETGAAIKPGWRAALASALLTAMPLYCTLIASGAAFAPRLDSQGKSLRYWSNLVTAPPGVDLRPDFVKRLGDAMRIYLFMPDQSRFYGGDTPLILGGLAAAFVLGVLWSLWRWRSPGGWLLLTWLALTYLGNLLLGHSAQSPRYVVVFPALALLLAIGIRYPLKRLLPGRIANWSVIALTLAAAFAQAHYYFGSHLDTFNQQIRAWNYDGYDGYDALFRAAVLPTGTRVYIVGAVQLYEADTRQMLHFLDRRDLTVQTWPNGIPSANLHNLTARATYAFFVPPDDAGMIDDLRARFPDLRGPFDTPYASVPSDRRLALYAAAP